MNKYMLLYRSPISSEEQMANADPEQNKKVMEIWMAWFGKCGDAVVDGGSPMGQAMNVSKTGNGNSDSQVRGYSIMQAENMETVEGLVADHPHLMIPGASVDILEMFAVPGM